MINPFSKNMIKLYERVTALLMNSFSDYETQFRISPWSIIQVVFWEAIPSGVNFGKYLKTTPIRVEMDGWNRSADLNNCAKS